MRQGDLVQLEVRPRVSGDVISYLVNSSTNKKVLNIGALGDIKHYLPDNLKHWLHDKLIQNAKKVVGLDIDKDGCAWAKEHGYEVINDDCETMQLGQKFDLIIMYEVIEHLNAPIKALQNVLSHLEQGGELIITTPNPTSLPQLVSTLLNKQPNTFYDHVVAFSPENIQAICDRLNVKLTNVDYFTRTDYRNFNFKLKSKLIQTLGGVFPRLHYQFAATLKN